jgi:hypothetical protein
MQAIQATQRLQQHEDIEAVARLASGSTRGSSCEVGRSLEARAQTQAEHQEQHGLQADKGAQDSDLSRRQIAISSEAFSSRSGGINDRPIRKSTSDEVAIGGLLRALVTDPARRTAAVRGCRSPRGARPPR